MIELQERTRFCIRCQTTRLKSEFVPAPGATRRSNVECCTYCANRIKTRMRELGLLPAVVQP